MDSAGSSNTHKKLSLIMFSSGMSMGTGLGICLGVVFNNIPVGLSLGAGVGIAIGVALSNYIKPKICN